MLSSPDSTVVWTGDDFPELGIEKGTSLNTVVNKLIQALRVHQIHRNQMYQQMILKLMVVI